MEQINYAIFNDVIKIREEDVRAVAIADIPYTYNDDNGVDVSEENYYIYIYTNFRQDPIMVPYEDKNERDTVFKRYKF